MSAVTAARLPPALSPPTAMRPGSAPISAACPATQRAAHAVVRGDAADHPAAAMIVDEDRSRRRAACGRVDAHGEVARGPGDAAVVDAGDGFGRAGGCRHRVDRGARALDA